MTCRDVVIDSISMLFPAADISSIDDDTTAADVEGWDSIGHVQLMLLLEEQTGKRFDVASTFSIPTIGELIAYIDGL